jgi:hypothetical protein
MKRLAVIAIIASALAGSAAVADSPVTATLVSPVSGSTESVAGGAVFSCKGATCVAESDTSQLDDIGMCRDLARQLGAVAKFGAMSAANVGKCNGAARH